MEIYQISFNPTPKETMKDTINNLNKEKKIKKFIDNYLDTWVLCNGAKTSFRKRYFLNIFDVIYAILLFPIYITIFFPIGFLLKKVIYKIEK